ncbi:hypothetical protein [Paracoccus tibetensis]|uniref:Uncharacterized protein n=1 Tax=Paracoccus tibetensis TaxID=336292 RepID=A0A1G5IXU0_9RHOB|nr:hypothetical protein [Paracoccus tibetensis]SCY80837.1 hypothetical protein SAMN05660710_02853 [Paracoccus tibetensis]
MFTETTASEAATSASDRWNSLSQRQRDTETLMRNFSLLANAKAANDEYLLSVARDEITASALYCQTSAVQKRYEACLVDHGWTIDQEGGEASATEDDSAPERWVSFSDKDFGGDIGALGDAVRAYLADRSRSDA